MPRADLTDAAVKTYLVRLPAGLQPRRDTAVARRHLTATAGRPGEPLRRCARAARDPMPPSSAPTTTRAISWRGVICAMDHYCCPSRTPMTATTCCSSSMHGRRTSPTSAAAATGTSAQTFVLASAGYDGDVPDGATLVEVPTSIFAIVGRVQVDGADDLPAVHALQDRFSLGPLSGRPTGNDRFGVPRVGGRRVRRPALVGAVPVVARRVSAVVGRRRVPRDRRPARAHRDVVAARLRGPRPRRSARRGTHARRRDARGTEQDVVEDGRRVEQRDARLRLQPRPPGHRHHRRPGMGRSPTAPRPT